MSYYLRDEVNRMKEEAGVVFSIAKSNDVVPGCTISKAVSAENGYYISYFSMASGTDISAESYNYHKLWIVSDGELTAYEQSGVKKKLQSGELFVTPIQEPIGVTAEKDSIYTEITLKEDTKMNQLLKAGEAFALKDLVPYQEGKIVNMDLISDPKLKLVVMSFDEGTGLSEHAAPGEALIFALDGEAIIGYEGNEYRIHAGENFKFDKMGKHSVTADHKFKMALLLQID